MRIFLEKFCSDSESFLLKVQKWKTSFPWEKITQLFFCTSFYCFEKAAEIFLPKLRQKIRIREKKLRNQEKTSTLSSTYSMNFRKHCWKLFCRNPKHLTSQSETKPESLGKCTRISSAQAKSKIGNLVAEVLLIFWNFSARGTWLNKMSFGKNYKIDSSHRYSTFFRSALKFSNSNCKNCSFGVQEKWYFLWNKKTTRT